MSSIDLNLITALNVIRIPTIIIGLVGNILSFIVFSRKPFAKNSISTYCRALALFECFILLQLVNDVGTYIFNTVPDLQSNVMCKIHVYASIGMSSIPGWILVVFALDKLICVLNTSNRFEFIKFRKFQYAVIAFIAVFNLILYIEIPIDVNIKYKINPLVALFKSIYYI